MHQASPVAQARLTLLAWHGGAGHARQGVSHTAGLGDALGCCAQALQEEYRKDLTLKEAEVLALSTLKQVMEEKVRHIAKTA